MYERARQVEDLALLRSRIAAESRLYGGLEISRADFGFVIRAETRPFADSDVDAFTIFVPN